MKILSDEEIRKIWIEVPVGEVSRAIEAAVVEKLKRKAWEGYAKLPKYYDVSDYINALFDEKEVGQCTS